MSAPRVCVVGSLHLDLVVRASHLPRLGETLMGDSWWWRPGGKGANQAMAAARHGAVTAMIGRLGADAFGVRMRDHLAAAGVDATFVGSTGAGAGASDTDTGTGAGSGGGAATGMSVAITQADGDYAAVVVSGANRSLDAAGVAASAVAIRAARVLILQHEIADEANVSAARVAREAGAQVILNAAPARPLGGMAGLIDLLVVNAVEAEMLGARALDDLAGAVGAAEDLLGMAPVVVVTAGGSGVAAVSRGAAAMRLPAHPVTGADAHGAGDAFVGALAARLAADEALGDALRYANAAAALHVGTPEAARAAIGPADVTRLLDTQTGGA